MNKHLQPGCKVMKQNLRPIPADPRCPQQWQVPVTRGNVLAVVYGSTADTPEGSKEECLARAALYAAAPEMLAELEQCGGILLALRIMLDGVVSQKVAGDIQARMDAIDTVLAKVRG